MDYDVIIVGAGPGGYTAAARAGALGKKVLLIEKADLGGTCLNAGCIPTKALLASAKLFGQMQVAGQYGVEVEQVRFNLGQAMARKNAIVAQLREGVAYQMRRHQVQMIAGEATFADRQTVLVNGESYHAPHIIIATGASGAVPPVPGIEYALSTDAALHIEQVPPRVLVLGSIELVFAYATILSLMGSQVTVIGKTDNLLPALDADVVDTVLASMQEAGVTFYWDVDLQAIEPHQVTGTRADGSVLQVETDAIINVWGRVPNVEGLAALDVDIDAHGVRVNEYMQTNLPGVYAIGDVTGRSMWATTAIRGAEVAVNHLCGIEDRMRYDAIPTVLYTSPEAASVGLTEAQARAAQLPIQTVKLPMKFNGRFLTESEGKRGICKVIVHAHTQAILGVHLMGGNASELIYGAAAMLEDEFRVQEVKAVLFAHPTMSEIIKDSLYEL